MISGVYILVVSGVSIAFSVYLGLSSRVLRVSNWTLFSGMHLHTGACLDFRCFQICEPYCYSIIGEFAFSGRLGF